MVRTISTINVPSVSLNCQISVFVIDKPRCEGELPLIGCQQKGQVKFQRSPNQHRHSAVRSLLKTGHYRPQTVCLHRYTGFYSKGRAGEVAVYREPDPVHLNPNRWRRAYNHYAAVGNIGDRAIKILNPEEFHADPYSPRGEQI